MLAGDTHEIWAMVNLTPMVYSMIPCIRLAFGSPCRWRKGRPTDFLVLVAATAISLSNGKFIASKVLERGQPVKSSPASHRSNQEAGQPFLFAACKHWSEQSETTHFHPLPNPDSQATLAV